MGLGPEPPQQLPAVRACPQPALPTGKAWGASAACRESCWLGAIAAAAAYIYIKQNFQQARKKPRRRDPISHVPHSSSYLYNLYTYIFRQYYIILPIFNIIYRTAARPCTPGGTTAATAAFAGLTSWRRRTPFCPVSPATPSATNAGRDTRNAGAPLPYPSQPHHHRPLADPAPAYTTYVYKRTKFETVRKLEV